MNSIVNIAAYKFVTLDDVEHRRAELFALSQRLSLKGTILLSAEGINLFLAGTSCAIEAFLCSVRSDPPFVDLEVKESLSNRQPFVRLFVKIKREIIAFGVAGIDPRRYTSRRVSATQLRRWLDEGTPITLLDVRNNFEYDAGTFENAIPVGVEHFRDFPRAIDQLPVEMKHGPVVAFCYGGLPLR